MTTQLTRNYWLDVFAGWVEARNMPGPQNDEALIVISELKAAEARAAALEQERDTLTTELERVKAERNHYRIALEQIENSGAEGSATGVDMFRIANRALPVDDETPFGQYIDGLGDEVEP